MSDRAPMPATGRKSHSKLQTYELGEVVAGCRILGRAENGPHGNARWRVEASCGHVATIEGIHLRSAQRRGSAGMKCLLCNPARPRALRKHAARNHHIVNAYKRPRRPVILCKVCCGVGHARPVDGCPGCGMPRVEESMARVRRVEMDRRRFDRE